MKTISAPHGLFSGGNFMTPAILGYYKLRGGLGYAELSQGEGIVHEPIFGVTVQSYDRPLNPDLSKMFHSKSEALDYIHQLSE